MRRPPDADTGPKTPKLDSSGDGERPAKHGGKRSGAGRPRGSQNTLGYGEVKALGVARLKLPETASQGEADLAAVALGRIVDVMNGVVDFRQSGSVLKAATRIREEICGPLAQKYEMTGKDGGPVVFQFPPIPGDDEP